MIRGTEMYVAKKFPLVIIFSFLFAFKPLPKKSGSYNKNMSQENLAVLDKKSCSTEKNLFNNIQPGEFPSDYSRQRDRDIEIPINYHVIYVAGDSIYMNVTVDNQNYPHCSWDIRDYDNNTFLLYPGFEFDYPGHSYSIGGVLPPGNYGLFLYDEFGTGGVSATVTTSSGQVLASVNQGSWGNYTFLDFTAPEGDFIEGLVSTEIIEQQTAVLNSAYNEFGYSFVTSSIDSAVNAGWYYATDSHKFETAQWNNTDQYLTMAQAMTIDVTHSINYFWTGARLTSGLGVHPWSFPEDDSRHGLFCGNYTIPGGEPGLNLGITGVHEVGHYLGLYHIFENGCSAPGDEVDDTPDQIEPNYLCPTSNYSCGSYDDIGNYMDYMDDDCLTHFTQGQKDRIDWAIETYRPILLENTILGYTGPIWHVATTGSDETGDGSEENPFGSIQRGLNISNEGDTVMVSSGTYIENINWPAVNGIVLIGSGQDQCIVDGDSSGAVILFSDSLGGIIDSTTLVTGFKIQNGSSGGLVCINSSPKITNSIVKNNINSVGDGGGIVIADSSSAIIQDVIVSQNISRYQYFVPGPGGPRFRGNGGGIFIALSDPKLINVTISDNESTYHGGGVSIGGHFEGSSPIFIDCTISGNISLFRAGGVHGVGRLGAHFIEGKIYNNTATGDGGGIHIGTPGLVDSSQIHFTDVDIFSNHSGSDGGGISIADPVIMNLAGCTIRNNSAGGSGGGISSINPAYSQGNIVFSPTNRNNIYSNFINYNGDYPRGQGLDIHVGEGVLMDVVLDTFTVSTPTEYYCTPIENYTFDILNGANSDVIDSNIFVSVNGDNNNSGLSSENAFKTIEYALSKIYADSININTIHLEPGVYSPNTNGEQFPIIWPNYVNLSGSGQEESIIMSDRLFTRLIIFNDVSGAVFDSVTIQSGGGLRFANSSATFNDITIADNTSNNGGAVYCGYYSSPIFNRVTFKNNVCEVDEVNSWNEDSGEGGAVFVDWESTPSFNYCSFINNRSERDGGAIAVSYGTPEFKNCLFTENISESDAGSIFIGNSPSDSILINNSTFYNNESQDSLGSNIKTNWAGLIITSSIMRNNQPKEFSDNFSLFYVSFSNIDGGFGGFANIDQDPLFCGADSLNFTLDEASPCVGSGQDGTNMGAFGVGCNSILYADDKLIPSNFMLYQNYPNPFNPHTTIRYDLPENNIVSVTIYDMMGRVVKNLVNGMQTAGFKSLRWDATNNRDQSVSTGLYIYTIHSDNYTDTKKMILLK